MAADAHLRASLTLDSNVQQAVDEAARGLNHLTGVAAKARDDIIKAAEKSDPIARMRRQQERELKAIEKVAAKSPELAELHEKARAAIIEKYARKRQQIEEQAAEKIARAQKKLDLRSRIGQIEQPINDLRGLMDSLGAATNTAGNQVAQLGADMIATFATGGAVGLAIGGTVALVTQLAGAWRDAANATREAKIAAIREFTGINDAIEDMTRQRRDQNLRMRLQVGGMSDAQIKADEDVGRAREARQSLLGSKMSAESNLERARQQLADANLAASFPGQDKFDRQQSAKAIAVAQAAVKAAEDRVALLKDEVAEADRNLEEATFAAQETLDLLKQLDKQKAIDRVTGGGLPAGSSARARAERLVRVSPASRRDTAGLSLGGFSNQLKMEPMELAKPPPREDIAVEWDQAGMAAGSAFAGSIKSFLDTQDPKDLFGGLLQAAAAVFSFTGLGGLSWATSLVGGFFEQGGVPFALHMAQGRNGLATLPGLNFDAKPAWLHKNEVVMPEAVVNGTFGGLPEAARVAAGGALPGGGGGSVTLNQTVVAFDPSSFRQVSDRTLEPVLSSRLSARQGARLREQIRIAGSVPRYA